MEDAYRKVKTLMLFLMFICMGILLEIPGPTMIDLRLRFQSTYDDVARGVSAMGLGMVFGAVAAGVLVDVLGTWRELLFTFSQLSATTTYILTPFVKDVDMLWFIFLSIGISIGILFVGCQRVLIIMWQSEANVPMLVLHTCAGLGSAVTPLIINNFLARLKFEPTLCNVNTSVPALGADHEFTIVKESRVHIAFLTTGIILAALSLPYFVYPFYQCYDRQRRGEYVNVDGTTDSYYEEKRTEKTQMRLLEAIDPATYANGARRFGVYVFIILFIFFFNSLGELQMFSNFVRTFSIDELHLQPSEAFYLDTTFWTSLTIGRFASAVLARFISIRKLLLVSMILHTATTTCLLLFKAQSHTAMWILTVAMGSTIGPTFPVFITFTSTLIDVRGIVLSYLLLAGGFGYQFYVWITGALYDIHGPRTVLYVTETAAAVTLVITVIFVVSTYSNGERFEKEQSFDSEDLVSDMELDSTRDLINENHVDYNTH